MEDSNRLLREQLDRVANTNERSLGDKEYRLIQQQFIDLESNNKFLQDEITRLLQLGGRRPEPEKIQLEMNSKELAQKLKKLEANNRLLQEEIRRLNQMYANQSNFDSTEAKQLRQQLKAAEEDNEVLQAEVDRLNEILLKREGLRAQSQEKKSGFVPQDDSEERAKTARQLELLKEQFSRELQEKIVSFTNQS